jgi:hypothetical protein
LPRPRVYITGTMRRLPCAVVRLATWQSAHRMLSTTSSAGVPGRLAKLMSAVATANVVTISSAVSAALSSTRGCRSLSPLT